MSPAGGAVLRSARLPAGTKGTQHGNRATDEGTAMAEPGTAPAVTGFHHFSPTVSDVEASAQWYERVFGMTRVPVPFPHYGDESGGYAVLMMDPRSGVAGGVHPHHADPGPGRRRG